MKVNIIFHSLYGHVWRLAEAVAEGAKQVKGTEVEIFQVKETLSDDILKRMNAVEAKKQFSHVPIATTDNLAEANAVIFGTPTRFGMMSAQMRAFLDSTGALWMIGALVGKVGSVFTSTGTQHGGQESTILSFHTTLSNEKGQRCAKMTRFSQIIQLLIACVAIFVFVSCKGSSGCSGGDSGIGSTIASGTISKNTTWSGEILVEERIIVPSGVTLTISPGTRILFKHYRGYKDPEKRLTLRIEGGLIAEGTADQPIYFTSDADVPQNGDWSMVRVYTPSGQVRFNYCVFEFAQQGLSVWRADVTIRNSVFRWNNWEGVYFESSCTATLENCQIYENGYNGLAAEQFNTITMTSCEVWRNGTNGVHIDASTGYVRASLVHDNMATGLSVDDNGHLRVEGTNLYNNTSAGIGVGEGKNIVEVGNLSFSDNGGGNLPYSYVTISTLYDIPDAINLGFSPDQSRALGYIPSDETLDGYLYVYPDDETRTIVKKIGAGLGLTWSLAWDGQYIWTATLGGRIYKLDPVSGGTVAEFAAPGSQPWGMTYDGQYLWLVDFAEKSISKIDPTDGSVETTYSTPDPVGGCKGAAWDGVHINVMGWTSPVIYQMDRMGNLVNTIKLNGNGGGGLAWDGKYFWVPGEKIYKYDTNGNIVGWIYPASEGTWDLEWDGTYLWAAQRTNENWADAKIFKLQVNPRPFSKASE